MLHEASYYEKNAPELKRGHVSPYPDRVDSLGVQKLRLSEIKRDFLSKIERSSIDIYNVETGRLSVTQLGEMRRSMIELPT